MGFADVIGVADVSGGALAASAALFEASVVEADFTLGAVEVVAASGGAGFFGGVAVLALGAGGVGGAASFAGSGIAVLAYAAGSVGGAASGFASIGFADGVGTAVGVATAAFDTFVGGADLAGATFIVAGAFGGGAFAGGAGLTARTVVDGLAAFDAFGSGADLTELALLVGRARGGADLASVVDALFVGGAVRIAAAAFGALGSSGLADEAAFTVGVGTAEVLFAATGDAERSRGTVVVGFATLTALILGADLAALADRVGAATFFASTRETDQAVGAVGVGFASGGGGRSRGFAGDANAVGALAFVTKEGLAVFGDAACGAADTIDAAFVAFTACVATTLRILVGGFGGAAEVLADESVGAVGGAGTCAGFGGVGIADAVVGVPVEIAVVAGVRAEAASEPSQRSRDQGQECKAERTSIHFSSPYISLHEKGSYGLVGFGGGRESCWFGL